MWCGPSGVWTQLSFSNYIKQGGRIDVSGLSSQNRESVFASLSKHAETFVQWQPVLLQGDSLTLGNQENPHELEWVDDGAGWVRSTRKGAEVFTHTKARSWFHT
jgi:hypothetical protein